MRALAVVALLAGISTACEAPTAPTPVGGDIPQVAGTYTGPLTMTVTDIPSDIDPPDCGMVSPGRCLAVGELEVGVTQVDDAITIHGELTWPGELPSALWGVEELTATVDRNGVVHREGPSDFDDDECGRTRFEHWRMRFGVRTLELDVAARSDCGRFHLEAVLDRT